MQASRFPAFPDTRIAVIARQTLAAAGLLLVCAAAHAASGPHTFGPFDYTNPLHVMKHLDVVEGHHFTPDVESLRAGASSAFVIHDLVYTLRTFPNHHRALASMSELWRRYEKKNMMPPGADASDTPEYYFETAINFAPHDSVVLMLYAIHLHKEGDHEEALKYYQLAEEKLPDSPELQYNMGLLYYDLHKLKTAKQYADKAYSNHYPLEGLRNKLKRAGAWN